VCGLPSYIPEWSASAEPALRLEREAMLVKEGGIAFLRRCFLRLRSGQAGQASFGEPQDRCR
jgi:hypothetical protein